MVAGTALVPSATSFAQTQTLPLSPPPEINTMTLELDVVAKALDLARGEIQPSLGATVYQLQRPNIESQPQGDNAPVNQLLLQAPGTAQDSFGQLHVRGDHANLQFRINGVQLPEGINVFGQVLQTRLASGEWGMEIAGGPAPRILQPKPVRIEVYRADDDIDCRLRTSGTGLFHLEAAAHDPSAAPPAVRH